MAAFPVAEATFAVRGESVLGFGNFDDPFHGGKPLGWYFSIHATLYLCVTSPVLRQTSRMESRCFWILSIVSCSDLEIFLYCILHIYSTEVTSVASSVICLAGIATRALPEAAELSGAACNE